MKSLRWRRVCWSDLHLLKSRLHILLRIAIFKRGLALDLGVVEDDSN